MVPHAPLMVHKPVNFMMNHQDYFTNKSFLIYDLRSLSAAELNAFENKKLKEEAKSRLENSIAMKKNYEV